MRKLFMILTLAVSFLAVSGVASSGVPGGVPECDPNCPWVR
jgi:hypothetical protein